MLQRLARSGFARHGVSLAIAGVTMLLVHLFLVRLPARLLVVRSVTAGIAPLTAADWAAPVEGTNLGASRGAGSGTLGRGIRAAPESH